MSTPIGLTLVTLGVSDVGRSAAFYTALGFHRVAKKHEGVAFFRAGGTALSLFPRADLAKDAGVSPEGSGFAGISLAINRPDEGSVDALIALATSLGGKVVKPAHKVFWGGYSGYFADPDGFLWEVAHNPFFPLDAQGRMTIPE
ncbi:VOC family protein [Acetobacteraceae bacterium H6797]|nr:VOC family protein [Acetobacteraceae bacterium H6797]